MHPTRPAPPLAAWVLVVLAGCFSNAKVAGDDAGSGAPVDAASGPQSVGSPCDPALATPCLATGDDCLGVYCDPVARLCTSFVTDAGAPCNSSAVTCTKSSDCDEGLACGFAIGGGCGATGTCIDVALQCEDDAAACVTGGTTCGCGGAPVAILIAGYAADPTPTSSGSGASSSGTCSADAGLAPADAGDGGG